MWCQAHPNEWNRLFSVSDYELWLTAQQVECVPIIDAGTLKDSREKKSIASLPIYLLY
jgi:hypothetical protein